MEEYIDKKTAIQLCMNSWDVNEAAQDIKDEPAAKVIELDPILKEYEAFIKTDPTNEQIDKWCASTMRKILSNHYAEKLAQFKVWQAKGKDNKIEKEVKMTKEQALEEINKVFDPAFANYIITALTEGATVSDKVLEQLPSKDCMSKDIIKLKIAEIPKYTEGTKIASTRRLKNFLEKEDFLEKEPKDERSVEITPDVCLGFTMALEYIKEFVNESPSMTPVQEWIPASERLPKKTGWYFITFKNAYGDIVVCEASYRKPENYWTDKNISRKLFDNDDIVAWMPLPKPYDKEMINEKSENKDDDLER